MLHFSRLRTALLFSLSLCAMAEAAKRKALKQTVEKKEEEKKVEFQQLPVANRCSQNACLNMLAQQLNWFQLLSDEEQLAMAYAVNEILLHSTVSRFDPYLLSMVTRYYCVEDLWQICYQHSFACYQDITTIDKITEKLKSDCIYSLRLVDHNPRRIALELKTISECEITKLDLSFNQIGFLSLEEFVQLIKSIPSTVIFLDLSGNSLYRFGVDGIVKALSFLSKSVRKLRRLKNGLERFSLQELITIANNIPTWVCSVAGLTTFKTTADLVEFVHAIPNNFQEVELNCIDDKDTEANLLQAARPFKPTIKQLSLCISPNFHENGRLKFWLNVIANLNEEIRTVKITAYAFFLEDLIQLLRGLTPFVYSLKLFGGNFGWLSKEKLRELIDAIPNTVKALKISSIVNAKQIETIYKLTEEREFEYLSVS